MASTRASYVMDTPAHGRPDRSRHRTGRTSLSCVSRLRELGAAVVDRPQVVLPFAGRPRELVEEHELVWSELRGRALVEAGVVSPPAQDPLIERNAVRPAYAARVEVLQHQPFARL